MLRFFGVWYLAPFTVKLEIYVLVKQQRNAIHQVCSAFSELIHHYVKIADTPGKANYKLQLHEGGNFPEVFGCMDCVDVLIHTLRPRFWGEQESK